MDCVYVDRERGANGVVNPEVHAGPLPTQATQLIAVL